jgi:hypothetical protein
MRAAVGNGGWTGDPDMTALRRHEAQAAPGYAKITDLNCSCLALMGDGSVADQSDLGTATRPRPAA